MQRRTVDRILSGEGLSTPKGAFGWKEWPTPIITPVGLWRDFSPPVIAIDNVAELVFATHQGKKIHTVAPTDFPSLDAISPSPYDGRWSDSGWGKITPHAWAIFVNSIRIDHDNPDRDDETVKGVNCLHLEEHGAPVNTDVNWIVEFLPFIDFGKPSRDRLLIGPVGHIVLELDRDGKSFTNKAYLAEDAFPFMESPELEEDHRKTFEQILGPLLVPSLYAISLMHCRNVEVIEQEPRKLTKRERKKNAVPVSSYHVLLVGNTKRRVSRGGGGGGEYNGDHDPTGRHVGLHIVRGHFKTFTKDAPLLGKHVGTWWWDDAVRGDENIGLIAKDYAVNPS
jgi:hypothetical protein